MHHHIGAREGFRGQAVAQIGHHPSVHLRIVRPAATTDAPHMRERPRDLGAEKSAGAGHDHQSGMDPPHAWPCIPRLARGGFSPRNELFEELGHAEKMRG